MTARKLTQEEPPPSKSFESKTDWNEIADELRRTGKWSVIAEDADFSLVTRVRKGSLVPFRPAGAFEAVARGSGTARHRAEKIYARFIRPEDRPEE